ncbi:MAG: PQQ-dependent sugar dehydrogenase, partial [Anaerolineaceae bacterium]|nr:PQQ-dependent sugar dehydrogenase [Anaerolineaceae bacterium]
MKLKNLLHLIFLFLLLLTACSDSEVTFTPPVVDFPTPTNVMVDTPDPTETFSEVETKETSQPVEAITEEKPTSVTTFPDTSQYQWLEIASGFTKPLGMTSFFDGNLLIYVLEQNGVIRVIENGSLLNAPFLDIKNKVTSSASEQGLLGIALDPNFATNGIFFLNYSGRGGNTVIARFVANEDRKSADPDSEQNILTYEQPYSNHNGGNLVFGPDGFLYIGLGDGGSGGDPEMRAQNPDTLLGKMLRIAVQDQEFYAIPSDNPFQSG